MRGVAPRSRSKSSQTSGASRRPRQSWAGVTRSAAKWAAHGRFVPLRHVTRRQARAGSAAAIARTASGRRVVVELQPRRRPAAARLARRHGDRRRPAKDGQRRRDAERIRQLQAMQRAAQRGVVAEFGIAEHRGDVEAGRADLPQQRERQAPFLLEAHASRESARAAAPRASATPRADTTRRPASTRARRSRAPRSPPLGSWPPCPACRNTGAPPRPSVGPASGNWSRRESARRCARGSRPAAAATRARRSTAHR